jgi:3-oxoacyl-[acyl-carrier-protein] synthase II
MKDSVLITGLGVISAAGGNLEESLDSLAAGRRNAGPVTLFKTPLDRPVFEVARIPGKFLMEGRRTAGLAMCAVEEALMNARLEGVLSELSVGVCMGTTVASQLNDIDFYATYRREGSAPLTAVERYLDGNLASFIAREIGANGPKITIVNACSSGTDAIGVALSWLRAGLCDIAIAGGADELNRVPYCGFNSLGIVSNEMCAPFDRDRKGLNLGEGAGVLVMETMSSALRRGITSGLLLTGYGSAADAYHLTAPRPDGAGLKRAIASAMDESGIEQGIGSGKVGFINAHGTATHDNDKVEGKAIGELFGNEIRIVSTKGYTGHALGAAGGIEAVFTAAGLREGWIPGTAGFKTFDEEIGITPVGGKTVVSGAYALSTSLAFGGNNSVIVLRTTD